MKGRVRPRIDFPKGREETAMLTKSLDYVGNIHLFGKKSKNTFRNSTLLIGTKTKIRSIEKSVILEQERQRMLGIYTQSGLYNLSFLDNK